MRLNSLKSWNFRNLENGGKCISSRQVLLTGENGQGKSNFLEALYLLCYGTSFRTSNIRHCVKIGETDMALHGSFVDDIGLSHTLSFIWKDKKREIKIDNRPIKDRKELLYTAPCIIFSHDDFRLVDGEPEVRRKFFDHTMSLYDPLYFDSLRSYKRVLKQRNAAIKQGNISLLPVYDMQLVSFGTKIMTARGQAIEEFNTLFSPLYKAVSGQDIPLRIDYTPSWNCTDEDELLGYLERTRDRDFQMMTTTSGIHRDRFTVKLERRNFASVGSTGQLRLVSLLFRVAQMAFYTLKTGKKPIILVDDVLLELDIKKRERFIEIINGYDQAFFTLLPREKYFVCDSDALHYRVEEGRLEEI